MKITQRRGGSRGFAEKISNAKPFEAQGKSVM
jgi:hypothetical protein